MKFWFCHGFVWFLLLNSYSVVSAQKIDINDAYQKAIQDAAKKVAPTLVRIETSGGQDVIVWVDPSSRQPIRKVVGPTTGIIVDSNGYIISSTFNFTNKPTDIFVTIPGKGRMVAHIVAQDETRMLTLLKVESTGLPIPQAYPKKDIMTGQWSIALGRALDANLDHLPTVNSGIISALNRIWGKAIQTDARISPNNYGGPLISLDGRIMGILVPASPEGEGDQAGVDLYDSGIGFAIPYEDILAVLPKLKKGTKEKTVTLRKGLLGFSLQNPQDMFDNPPTLGIVSPKSSSAKAGLRRGDLILEINHKPVVNQAQMLTILRQLYEGDKVSLKIRRGKKEIFFDSLVLNSSQNAFESGFLGVLLIRDDPAVGVEIRYVYPGSPAEKAGLKPGDRIMGIQSVLPESSDPVPGKKTKGQPFISFAGNIAFSDLMSRFTSGNEIRILVKKKETKKFNVVTVQLTDLIDDIPLLIPPTEDSTKKRALDPLEDVVPLDSDGNPIKVVGPPTGPPIGKKDPRPKKEDPIPPREVPSDKKDDNSSPKKEDPKDTKSKDTPSKEKLDKDKLDKTPPKKKEVSKPPVGFLKRENPALGTKYWMYVPTSYDPNVAHGLVVWLHPADVQGRDADDMASIWAPYLRDYNLIMLGPISKAKEGWTPSESESILSDVKDVMKVYTIDKQRVIAHGSGIGGQMAFYLGFRARDIFRGVAAHGAVLASQPKDIVPTQRLQFFISYGLSDTIAKNISSSKTKLADKKYSVLVREIPGLGKQYLDAEQGEGTLQDLLRWIDCLDRQ